MSCKAFSGIKPLIVSSSLNPESRSRRLALWLRDKWREEGVEANFIDLMDTDLPLCDGGAAYSDEAARDVAERVAEADAYVFATPVYVYSVNAALKNFVELTGRGMEDKPAGFLCAGGGSMSYMSVMGLANSLMLDYRMIILPRFVYATKGDWNGDIPGPAIEKRLEGFAAEFARLASKLTR